MHRVFLLAAAVLAALPATASAQTVYSSLPLHGATRPTSEAIVAGARLALKDAGSPIKYVSLDDSTRRAGNWTPERAAANARRAAQSGSAIAYIGEFNSGASQVALPILNEAAIPMISPSNTEIGLTRDGPGTMPGEPEKYYPTGERTYFRLTPNDTVQGGAVAAAMKAHGCTKAGLLTDDELYGRGVGAYVRSAAKKLGVAIAVKQTLARRHSYRSLAAKIRAAGADCVAFTGITANGAIQLFKDLGRALPKAQLFGSDGIADNDFAAHVPASVAARTLITVATLAPDAYPGAAKVPPNADPYFLYGYEAMKLIIDAVAAGATTAPKVTAYLHTIKDRASVIGTYSFDAAGDTTFKGYGVYGISKHRLGYVQEVTAP